MMSFSQSQHLQQTNPTSHPTTNPKSFLHQIMHSLQQQSQQHDSQYPSFPLNHNDSFTNLTNNYQSKPQTDDILQRMTKHLKNIYDQNKSIENQIYQIKNNPKTFIQPLMNKLRLKVEELKQENGRIRKMVDYQKMPVYSEMKRKSIANNQNPQQQRQARDSMRSSMGQSMRNSLTNRSALSQINSNSNFDKQQTTSTCFNQSQRFLRPHPPTNPILKLQKPSTSQQQQRQRLTTQIHYLIAKTQIFQSTLTQIKSKQQKQLAENQKRINQQEQQIVKIQQYKKKLLRLLHKLKSREIELNQMVKMYKNLHQETIKKLKQSTEQLKMLQERQVEQDVEKKYKEVLELENRLQIINNELQQMDQQKWLQKAYKELIIVCKRLGISIPKSESARQGIDQLCQILIQHHLICKNDGLQKLDKLKQYHEEQTHNSQRIIQQMKAKQQTLSKKLNQIQIQKGSNNKK